MSYAYINYKKLVAKGPVVESLRDVIVSINRRNTQGYSGSILQPRTSRLRAENSSPYGAVLPRERPQTLRQAQAPVVRFEKAAGWLTGILGLGTAIAIVGLSLWMLVVWNTNPPTGTARTSTVLDAYEVSGFSDSSPIAAYFYTALTAAAPQVMLALISLLNLSILELFYLNKTWASLEHGATLSSTKYHFKIWKPKTLPAAGKRGPFGIMILALLPALEHAVTALAIAQQELFCESREYDNNFCSRETQLVGGTGFDISIMWTSYKLIINQIFLLIAGLGFALITAVALFIANTKPEQAMPPFYGRVESVAAELTEPIYHLQDSTRLRWSASERT
ncbi:hypothetical protein ABW20_dc0105668 [Dactylellina cionopaga]|nr:hypothetical protein ABW20_dc0105668 [Dactylellina cionopaga]